MDLRQTPQYANYLKDLNWIVEERQDVYYFIKKIPILGSVIKIQRPKKIDMDFIEKLAKKHRAFQMILEPTTSVINPQEGTRNSTLKLSRTNIGLVRQSSTSVWSVVHKSIIDAGYKLARSSYLPTKTTIINLKNSEGILLKKMHYKTRYNIKKAHDIGLVAKSSDNTILFADFWQSCALKQRGMYISQKNEIHAMYKSFKGKSNIVFVYGKGAHPLAGVFSVYTKGAAFYMFAAATNEGKKLFAPTLAAWTSIKLAKKAGLKYYDFEGVYDERFPLPSWKGFSRFKISFGGEVVEYPGSFVKMRLPI